MTIEDYEVFKYDNVCRFCEKVIKSDKVRDHCRLTRKYRVPVHSKYNINVTQDKSIFFLSYFIIIVTMFVISS